MVDFNKLKKNNAKARPIEPIEIFRRAPKPPGINDLYGSQAEILHGWFGRRGHRDVVLKLHTGGGKTLVGLLIAQSTLNETGDPVLYLTPTNQLVQQTLEKAKELGINVVEYQKGAPLNDAFVNGQAVMVGNYNILFNGKSKFGVRGNGQPQRVGAIVLDDAHAAFGVVRDAFTLEIQTSDNNGRYEALVDLFRKAFQDTGKLGTLEDIVEGSDFSILEVPHWAWHEQLDAVRAQLKSDANKYPLVWPLLRDNLHLCHALVSRQAFTITPILPLVSMFPTLADAPRRVYMSATLPDDSEIIRTFNAAGDALSGALQSRSLAGISERMILLPDLLSFQFTEEHLQELLDWTAQKNLGTVILVPSGKEAEKWAGSTKVAESSREVAELVADLQSRATSGPVTFANRYDGIDLPGDSCRLLVMSGMPAGTSSYELFRGSALYGGTSIQRLIAQRIEQGIGRGARGAGDHCVVILTGSDLASWVSKDANFQFLTLGTRAQLEMGISITKEVADFRDLTNTISLSLMRDKRWTEYHAGTLADLADEDSADTLAGELAAIERKAFDLWTDGYHVQAIARLEKFLASYETLDPQTCGWIQQMIARIADNWGNAQLAQDWQKKAYANNHNLTRPKIAPPYRPLPLPGDQAKSIVQQIGGFRIRHGFLQRFEEACSALHPDSSANQFERALSDFATMIGFASQRFDANGEGPDVLWLLPNRVGFVIEAKSRKKAKNALTKDQHGQLLVAAEWFKEHYPGYEHVRVSVHPQNLSTRAAVAGASHALTYEKLGKMISDARVLLSALCDSQCDEHELEMECERLLDHSDLRADKVVNGYLRPFEAVE